MTAWDSKELEALRDELASLDERMAEYLHIIQAQSYFDALAARRRDLAEDINRHLDRYVRATPDAYDTFVEGEPKWKPPSTAAGLEWAPGFGGKRQ